MEVLLRMSVKRHAFPRKDCSICENHKRMIKERSKLTEDIKLLSSHGLPTPIASSKLDKVSGRIRDCNTGNCQGNER